MADVNQNTAATAGKVFPEMGKSFPAGENEERTDAAPAYDLDALTEDTVNEAAARIFARLCEFDDRTSPPEYPDMVLVTADELAWLMAEEFARSSNESGGRAP